MLQIAASVSCPVFLLFGISDDLLGNLCHVSRLTVFHSPFGLSWDSVGLRTTGAKTGEDQVNGQLVDGVENCPQGVSVCVCDRLVLWVIAILHVNLLTARSVTEKNT